MREMYLTLKADLNADLNTVQTWYTALQDLGETLDTPEQAIVAAYYLHNLYTAFEHTFERIAETFENHLQDESRWHAQLLRRMTLDIPSLRPRLLGADSADCLDELRRFRHVFRSAYTTRIDPDRLRLVLRRAGRLRELYPPELAAFQAFLDQISREPEE